MGRGFTVDIGITLDIKEYLASGLTKEEVVSFIESFDDPGSLYSAKVRVHPSVFGEDKVLISTELASGEAAHILARDIKAGLSTQSKLRKFRNGDVVTQ